MKKFGALLKESVWDYMKDNVKSVIASVITVFIAVLPSFIQQINSVELKIRLPIVILFIIILLVTIINIIILFKKYTTLKRDYEEALNPSNKNISKFQQGDIVILKIEKTSKKPKKMVVIKILKSEIICRDESGNLNKYVPEELLTAEETSIRLTEINIEQQRVENEQRELSEAISSFYSYN
jgi:ABC-type multidrug transport system fused ATPase/permease subunit